MTHGDKSKAKKAASKASAKTSKASPKGVKGGGKAVQTGKKGSSAKAAPKPAPKAVEPQAVARPDAGVKGRPARPAAVGPPGFNNPVVADAFKRAIKKYPNAFRRLTD